MSKAYKCDVCGKFCNDCYSVGDAFSIYPHDYAGRGYPDVQHKTQIKDMCEECYEDIRKYIHDRFFKITEKELSKHRI